MSRNLPLKLTSLLSCVFFFSGFTALIYQVAWQRLLTLYYGVGAVSITLIVSVYMLGLGLGALFGGFMAERIRNKIVLYFLVELLIGCFGLISLPFLDFLGRHTAGSSYELSFFYMFLFLSIPTFLMGITLPLLTKIFNNLLNNFLNTVSLLYFINTLGAAVGAVFASYVFISLWGLDAAVYFAAAINFILATLIFIARSSQPKQPGEYAVGLGENNEGLLGRFAYLLVFVTGFIAIGYEIVWFRVVGFLVKDSPYAFSSILSVYLFGIALGSYGMSKYLRRYENADKRNLFFVIQFLIGVSVIIIFTSYYYSTKFTFLSGLTYHSFRIVQHPFFNIPSFSSLTNFFIDTYLLVDVFFWSLVFVFIPTMLMGASFPLISTLALSDRTKEGKTVGTVYFFNIAGNVFGGVLTGFLLLPYLGTELTLIGFSLVGILFILFVSKKIAWQAHIMKKASLAFALFLITIISFPKQGQLYKAMAIDMNYEKWEPFFEEGIDGVILTYRQFQGQDHLRNFINGLIHGVYPGYGHYYQAVEALSFASKVQNVLIIGYGTGSLAEAVLKSEEVKEVTLVEISGSLISNLQKIPVCREVLDNTKLNLIIDDGRRYLLRTDKKFDIILMDPLRTTTSYSNNLYSHQFFKLAGEHLTSEGVLMVWRDEDKVMPRTILSAFKHVRLYKRFALASNTPFADRNSDRETSILAHFQPQKRDGILQAARNKELEYLGDQSYIMTFSDRYPINQDWRPVCEYYLGIKVREIIFDL